MTNTEESLNRGIFVASLFSLENNDFWGNDRLKDAPDFHRETLK